MIATIFTASAFAATPLTAATAAAPTAAAGMLGGLPFQRLAGSTDGLSNYRKLGTLPECTSYYEEDKCELNHKQDSDWGHCNRMEFGACHVGWRCAYIRGFSEGQCQPSGRALRTLQAAAWN